MEDKINKKSTDTETNKVNTEVSIIPKPETTQVSLMGNDLHLPFPVIRTESDETDMYKETPY